MATIHDVARLAGVSVATVSRVLNNSRPVKEEHRQRVEEAVAELDYSINIAGRTLRRQRSDTILYTFDTAMSYLERGLQMTAQREGLSVLHMYTGFIDDGSYIRMLNNGLVDGVIFGTEVSSEVVEKVAGKNVVYCANRMETGSVYMDDVGAARALTERLIAAGYRRIGFLAYETFQEKPLWVSLKREQGYLEALNAAGLEAVPELRVVSKPYYENALEAAGQFLALPRERQPDAIVYSFGIHGAALVNALQSGGVRVPEDIAVAGFENQNTDVICVPQLTVVRMPQQQLGAAAANMLMAMIQGEAEPPSRRIDGFEILRRESARV